MTSDQRSPRKRQLKAGTIGFNGGGGIDSIVKNLSGTGALLQVESVIGIPDQFTLFIWPAPGSEDTELGVLMEPEVGHGETEVYPRVQA